MIFGGSEKAENSGYMSAAFRKLEERYGVGGI